MTMMMRACLVGCLAAVLFATGAPAQTIGYADAIDRLAAGCGADIDRYCKRENLAGILPCLDGAAISARCRVEIVNVRTLLRRRMAARATVLRICDRDIRRLCAGIQPGDGNLLSCFYKTRQNASASCRQAVRDAGYE